jgi:hypothetical protein
MSTLNSDGSGDFDYGYASDPVDALREEIYSIVAEARRGEIDVDELEATLEHLAHATGYGDPAAMCDELGVEFWIRRGVDSDEVL